MRDDKTGNEPRASNEWRDWLVIGLFAGASALLVWLPLLMSRHAV